MWQHLIIDNFLTDEHFDFICKNLIFNNVQDSSENRDTFAVSKDNVINIRKTNGVTNLHSEFILDMYLTYNPRLLTYLESLAPEKMKDYHETNISFVAGSKNYSYEKHTDIRDKLLSVVVYLHPEHNTGTRLYEHPTDQEPAKIVEWRPNRALIFARSDQTWHSFESDKISDRYTLMFYLLSSKRPRCGTYDICARVVENGVWRG